MFCVSCFLCSLCSLCSCVLLCPCLSPAARRPPGECQHRQQFGQQGLSRLQVRRLCGSGLPLIVGGAVTPLERTLSEREGSSKMSIVSSICGDLVLAERVAAILPYRLCASNSDMSEFSAHAFLNFHFALACGECVNHTLDPSVSHSSSRTQARGARLTSPSRPLFGHREMVSRRTPYPIPTPPVSASNSWFSATIEPNYFWLFRGIRYRFTI